MEKNLLTIFVSLSLSLTSTGLVAVNVKTPLQVEPSLLKGNMGNQNYPIPENTDLEKYNTVLIWCQAFSTLFGSSKLSTI